MGFENAIIELLVVSPSESLHLVCSIVNILLNMLTAKVIMQKQLSKRKLPIL